MLCCGMLNCIWLMKIRLPNYRGDELIKGLKAHLYEYLLKSEAIFEKVDQGSRRICIQCCSKDIGGQNLVTLSL